MKNDSGGARCNGDILDGPDIMERFWIEQI